MTEGTILARHSKHFRTDDELDEVEDDLDELEDEFEDDAPALDELSRGSRRAAAHYSQKRKSAGKHHVLRNVLIGVAAVVLVAVVAVAAYVHHINSQLNGDLDPSLSSVLTSTDAGEPFYMLLLGIDKDEARTEGTEYGKDSSAYRSDSIMVARVDPQNKKVTLVSIHRDTLVELGEHGEQKINAAYSFGGPTYATEVISDFAGVKLSHYAQIDMDGMAKVVDSVGGVDVNLPIPVVDPEYTGLNLPEGQQHLDGKTAALLCRARHAYDSYGDGDMYRAANQRAVFSAVAKKVLSSDAPTMMNSVSAMAEMIDTDMDVNSIVSLAMQFRGMNVDTDIMSGMEPTTSEYKNNIWYEICNEDEWHAMMKRVDEGKPPYASTAQDATANVSAQEIKDPGSEDSSKPEKKYEGKVQVINASSTNGVATKVANSLTDSGFTASAETGQSTSNTTRIIYNGDDATKAKQVAEVLGLEVEPTKNDGNYLTDQDVIVVLGTDKF